MSRSEQPAAIPVRGASLSGAVEAASGPNPPGGDSGVESGWVLEGLFVPSEVDRGAAVMAPPHPLYGGSMENPVVSEIADACHACELSSLRFNWRGVGASGGSASGAPEAGAADYRAALQFVEDSSDGPIVACGYSFGAASAVTAAACSERVTALLLVAPPLVMLDDAALKAFSGRVLLVAGDRDEYAPRPELELLARGLERCEHVSLADTDHYFMYGVAELGRAARQFLQRIA